MSKAAMIYPGNISAELIKELKQNDISFYEADIKQAVCIAKDCEKQGVDVIISRAGLEAAIKKTVKVPVVNCEVTHSDIVNSILMIKKELGPQVREIGLFNYASVTYDVKYIQEMTNIRIHQFWYWDDPEALRKSLLECKAAGIEVALGANMTMKYSQEVGMKGYMKLIGKETLAQAIQKAHEISEIRRKDLEYAEKIKGILSFAREGILFVNEENKIDYANPRAAEILADYGNSLQGKQVAKVIPNWSNNQDGVFLDQITQTPSSQIIYNRVPVNVKNKNYGSVVTFSETAQIQEVEEKIRSFLHDKGLVAKHNLSDIIGESSAIKAAVEKVKIYGQTDATVLIVGETGTGKELFAHSLHQVSSRRKHPFLAINCAALPENLLESELFGYTEGAFTGAKKGGRAGYFELAHRGTLFLDEIGELKPHLQGKLLRAIQEKEVMRIGDDKIIPVDTRIIAATNQNLVELVSKKQFRSDLFYRLNALRIQLPTLRERIEDLPLLIKQFAYKFYAGQMQSVPVISKRLMKAMCEYAWPGNVRELECLSNRYFLLAHVLGDDAVLGELKNFDTDHTEEPFEFVVSVGSMEEMQEDICARLYELTGHNKTQTAKILGVNRVTVAKWLEKKKKYN